MTAGLLIALAGLVATSSPRHVTTRAPAAASARSLRAVRAPDTQSAILVDAPGTTGTVNLGGVTAGLDSVGVEGNLWAPGGPELKPDVAAGVEPGTAVDGVVTPLVKGVSNGSGDVKVDVPRIGSIDPVKVDVSANGAVGVSVKTANAVSIDPSYGLTRGHYFEAGTLVPARLDVTGIYACARAGSDLSVQVTDPFKISNEGFEVDDNLVCDGTTRTWSVSVEMSSDPQGSVEVTADLSKDHRSLAQAQRDVNHSG
ncbi:MAG TPA: hypothetical protein VG779_02400 [Actinomycetota bacterium]|nr:hypothetical protein [Actinomycetota bacterium]